MSPKITSVRKLPKYILNVYHRHAERFSLNATNNEGIDFLEYYNFHTKYNRM